ncbi:hypothetical protein BGM19_00650 [Streptomyces agglomeratus]|uniref:Scr1 family TA system antitoxin-like transcriptional regulator n=1 Tax=Streptomyces agglomeratus TaxID=285458 RepID=UPI00085278E3|nr:Scr1 family TA system antitoxin-like transcriptional regulator [Streptomyces agglomeratus]OEJ49559.1 hypothetical protein BGK72_00750 [Streptomyces agglomeratus]OEJ56781.1 hypothetical protein BGM19_00650 [Streptomyces agglomeratus]
MAANNDPTVRGAVVYLERFTSGLCLERPADVQQYSALYTNLQAQAHSPDHTQHLITDTNKLYTSSALAAEPSRAATTTPAPW